ncbi:MAG: Tn3 family transposase [Alphaproteobacteria bacterium]|nr:Tn3 family transposase [Alphaproteobacteria bacterium]
MATTISIISKREQKLFDGIPSFNFEERTLYFALSEDEYDVVKKLKNPASKIGFVLQLGYFKSHGKFYTPNQFKKYDIDYVARSLGVQKSLFEGYKKSVASRHRKQIIDLQSWVPFDNTQREKIEAHINWAIPTQIIPKKVFLSTIDFCWANRIEVPSYSALSTIITNAYNAFERSLVKNLSKSLTKSHYKKMEDLLSLPFTQLKNINQSIRPMDIKSSVEEFNTFYEYFNTFKDPIEALNLSDQATEYFGTWVQKSLASQLTRFEKPKTTLHVLSYIKNRLYVRNDFLMDTFLQVVQTTVNKAHKSINEMEKETRAERNQSIKKLSTYQQEAHTSMLSIKNALHSSMNDQEKLKNIKDIIDAYSVDQEDVDLLTKSLEKTSNTYALYDALEPLSIRMQRKLTPILKILKFNPTNSDAEILKALEHFVATDGNVGNNPPMSFINDDLKPILYKKNKLRTSLYKCLLCMHIAKGVKSGQLNLMHSYRYRSIDEYLMDKESFNNNKEQFLKNADLWKFKDFSSTIKKLEKDLDDKYKLVNESFDQNPHLQLTKKGNLRILTPKTSDTHKEYTSSLLTSVGYVPIIQALQTINQVSGFTEEFEHFSIKHKKMKPTIIMLLAGIIGKGCNIGVRKIANISKGIGEDKLKNIINWFFSLKNIQKANNRILIITNKLALANLYRHSKDELHTGSDGCKMNVRPPSIFGSYSYKYFGKGKGVSIYTFLDERNLLFHSTVISASEREAAYVIDGLLQNDVLKSTIHSTDTHGFTEMVFAGMYFIDVSFAPRIKNITHQRLCGFKSKKIYKKKGYTILPSVSINRKLIESKWDDILRFMATIKLKHTSASQLFKRLSSYAKDNPLYLALKEFGKIIKTSFILTYFQDMILRQRIEKQLNKVEQANRFSRAVFFANNQEFKYATKEEQEIATACKTLIQNAIVLWNYLYISQLLINCKTEAERKEMIEHLKKSSIVVWQHINFQGEYDFIKYAANSNIPFDLETIMNLEVA